MQPERRELFLKVILVMAICMLAGPEIIPAIEFTTLLELLGATLFIGAFSAAARLVVQDTARFVADALLPPMLVVVYRQSTRPFEKGSVACYLVLHVTYCLLLTAVGVAFVLTWGRH
jgi:hypothetical protein